tara:strand:- start:11669 stop:12196 length:528 start_codon:yes stop_codon:yes gene_type:complete
MALFGNNKAKFSSKFGVDVKLIGDRELRRAIKLLGEKDAQRIARLAVRQSLKDMQSTAKQAVAVDDGDTKEQIQISLKRKRGGNEITGRVGVGLKGGSRRKLAAIIEFGRRAFTASIVGRNGTTYRVKIPAVPGQFYLTRAADRHLPSLFKDIKKEFNRRIKNRIKRLAKQAGVK